jgi:hypothetical protein
MRFTTALLLTATLALAAEGEAVAQDFPIGASVDVYSGIEGGGKGLAKGIRRAPTLFRFGGEMALSDWPGPRIGAAVLLEIEPRTAVGADLRYLHLVGERFALHLDGRAIIAPSTLFGAAAGGEARLPLHKRFSLTFGPTLSAFFVGNDLPQGTVIFQGLFHVGVHVHLR